MKLGDYKGVSVARDEAHERVILKGLAMHHPQHATAKNVSKIAPIVSEIQDNLLKQFFPS